MEGILWRLATGVPWRGLPERFGPWATVPARFRRWQRAGVWERALAAIQADADARGERAGNARGTRLGPPLPRRHHGPGARARRGGRKGGGDQALGRSRGGFSTKVHLRAEGGGKPVTFVLTPGQRHEATQVATLLERGAVTRRCGRARLRPDRVAGGKGYTGRPIRRYLRRYLRRRGIGAVIPRQAAEPRRGVRFDRAAYRARNRIERTIGRLKQFRAVATRYDKLADHYAGLLSVACIKLWL